MIPARHSLLRARFSSLRLLVRLGSDRESLTALEELEQERARRDARRARERARALERLRIGYRDETAV